MARSRGRLFFAKRCDEGEGTATLLDEEAHHAYRVLRLNPGDEVGILYDGRRYPGVLDGGAKVKLLGRGKSQRGPRIEVLLGVGRPKAQAAAAILEAATAMGAAEIAFLDTERAVARGSGSVERWSRTVREACKQCGRYRPPGVRGSLPLAGWLDRIPSATVKLRLSEIGGASPRAIESEADWDGPLALLCGPEGGLSAAEEGMAAEAGFVALSLGPLVLRVETAVCAVLGWLAPRIWADPGDAA